MVSCMRLHSIIKCKYLFSDKLDYTKNFKHKGKDDNNNILNKNLISDYNKNVIIKRRKIFLSQSKFSVIDKKISKFHCLNSLNFDLALLSKTITYICICRVGKVTL